MTAPSMTSRFMLFTLLALLLGCSENSVESTSPSTPEAVPTLHVTVADDPALATAITREWNARAGTDITVKNISLAELLTARSITTDLIILPSGALGSLANQDRLLPLEKHLGPGLAKHHEGLLPAARQDEVRWGPQAMAASLGSPQLMLYYRRDLFQALDLEPPTTWRQYQELITTLSDRSSIATIIPTDQEAWQATAEPLGPSWAGITLLARAAAYVRHPNQYSGTFDYLSMEPLITGEPFVRALDELRRTTMEYDALNWAPSPAEARQRFYQGEAAMALSWPSRASDNPDSKATIKPSSVAWALLPGSREVYNASDRKWESLPTQEPPHVPLLGISGRVGAICRNTSHPRFAAESLARLTSTKWSAAISRRSPFTTMFRTNHLVDPLPWMDVDTSATAADQFASVLQQAHAPARSMICLRLPGRDQYLAALDQAVQAVLAQQATPQQALAHAANQWNSITEALGRDSQGRAYRQSLGLSP